MRARQNPEIILRKSCFFIQLDLLFAFKRTQYTCVSFEIQHTTSQDDGLSFRIQVVFETL